LSRSQRIPPSMPSYPSHGEAIDEEEEEEEEGGR